ncbi:MAG: hypothetical protein M3332_09955 [Actinomycetota bacterium]|nr:hypothetical protein [Actinomycetota bacterium]
MLAVTSSDLDPLPHQIKAGYGELMLRGDLAVRCAGYGRAPTVPATPRSAMIVNDLRTCDLTSAKVEVASSSQ